MRRALDSSVAAVTGAGGTRRITALLMPWSTPEMVTDDGRNFYRESFARGSLLMRAGVPVTTVDDHDAANGVSGPVIGVLIETEDTPEGLLGVLEVDAGADATLAAEDSLAAGDPLGVSVEFDSLGIDDADPSGGVIRRAAVLTAVALATGARAQYRQARVLSMRATTTEEPTLADQPTTTDETTDPPVAGDQADDDTTDHEGESTDMSTATAPDTTTTTAAPDETQRRALSEQNRGGARTTARPAASPLTRFRSWGHYAFEVAAGSATEFEIAAYRDAVGTGHRRALVTQATADAAGLMPVAWVTDVVDLIGTARPFVEAFHQAPLPDKGMEVDFPIVTTRVSTAAQAAELDEVSSTKASITKGSSAVKTFSGGEQMSLQLVRRSDPGYLELVMELYAEELAIDMDVAAITAALTAIPGGNELAISAATDLNTGLNARLVAGAKKILTGRVGIPEVLVAGLDVWEQFAVAKDSTGRPLYPEVLGAGGEPGSGTIAIQGGKSQVRNIEFVPDANMTATKAVFGWRRAFTTMMTPVETISADTIAKLGKEYAVFQMAAFLARRPTAAVEFTLGA